MRSLFGGIGRRAALLLLGVAVFPVVPTYGWAADVPGQLVAQMEPGDNDRERAVRLARDGHYAAALDILERLHREAPDDLPLRADLAAVLSWAGRDQDAVELGEHLPFDRLESFVAEAVARSARNIGRPGLAASLYLEAATRTPERVDPHIGFTLAILEGGHVQSAVAAFEETLARFPDHPQVLLAGGHVTRAADRPYEAALLYRRAEAAGADATEARRYEILSLLDGGAVHLASERMAGGFDNLHAGERGRLLAARGSRLVQWSVAAPTTFHPAHRFLGTDRALGAIDSALVVVDSDEGFPWRQLRFDRIVVLREQSRMEAVLEDAHELEELGIELPPYVLRMVGDANLSLRRTDEAERRYRAALDGWPDHPESTVGLFYALIQGERHADARAVIRSMLESQPEVRTSEGLREPLSNPDRLSAVIAQHLGMAFSGDLKGAQSGLDELLALAPLNLDLRQERASVYLWRGWPRAGLDEYGRILALDPDHVGARIGVASGLLDLDERASARATIDTLMTLAPENEHVTRVAERFRVDGLWEFSVAGHGARSSGGEFGTRDDAVRTRLTTPPIGDRVRLFTGLDRSRARFPDMRGLHDRVTIGGELRSRGVMLSLEATADRVGAERPGGAARIEIRAGDHWAAHIGGDSHSAAVPLQATREDVDGWRAEVGIRHRASERRWWVVEGAVLEMSDGNRRRSVRSALEQELVSFPRSRLTGMLEAYAATSSRADAPYFNPSRIVSTSATTRWETVLWRSYDRSVTQRILGTGGTVFQEGFEDEFIYSAEYAQAWVLSPLFQVDLGVQWGRPVYDGDRENRTLFHASLSWRLPR
jgi:biofilm PGA synthesis protein PgaA